MRSILLDIKVGTPPDLYTFPKKYLPPFIIIIDKNNRSRIFTMDWLLKNREEIAIKIVFKTTRIYYA